MFFVWRIQVDSIPAFFEEFLMMVGGILTAIMIEHDDTWSHKAHALMAQEIAHHFKA